MTKKLSAHIQPNRAFTDVKRETLQPSAFLLIEGSLPPHRVPQEHPWQSNSKSTDYEEITARPSPQYLSDGLHSIKHKHNNLCFLQSLLALAICHFSNMASTVIKLLHPFFSHPACCVHQLHRAVLIVE